MRALPPIQAICSEWAAFGSLGPWCDAVFRLMDDLGKQKAIWPEELLNKLLARCLNWAAILHLPGVLFLLLGRCVLARSNSFAEESAMCPLEGEWALAWSSGGPIAHVEGAQLHEARSVFFDDMHTGLGRAALKQCADSERSWNGSAIMCSSEMGFFRK